jgi:rhamnosyltransferase
MAKRQFATGKIGLSTMGITSKLPVVAVISAFNPDMDVVRRVVDLAQSLDLVIVVDDSGINRASSEPDIWDISVLPKNLRVRRNDKNSGIAAALNTGIREALRSGTEYVLTLDQDTSIPLEVISALHSALDSRSQVDGQFLAAAPDSVNNSRYACTHAVSGALCSIEVIQSGLMIRRAAFRLVGFFREDLFIDAVEVEYMIRMHREKQHVLLVPNLDLTQPLGSPLRIERWGRTFETSNHAAFRRYYITRNRIVLLLKFGWREPRWAWVSGRRLVRQSLRAALIEPDREAKRHEMAVGAWHALRGRMGARG